MMEFSLSAQDQTEYIENQQKEINISLKTFTLKLEQFEWLIEDKIDKHALEPIWKNFERFALYEDFKDLYNKTLPEIKKFEERIISFDAEIEKNIQIIKEFDISITQKANKVS